jgi:hypothetical protein
MQPLPQQPMAPAAARNDIFGPRPAAAPAMPQVTQPQRPGMPPAGGLDMFSKTPPSAIDVQVDQPSYQAMLSAQDQQELFGHERLTTAQKIVIVLIAFLALGLILGAGLWVYFKVLGAGDTTLLDSDADGLTDTEEATLGTNPDNRDTDGDGFFDGEEVRNGYSPLGK